MNPQISSLKLYELYLDTLERCGIYLLDAGDEEIGYQVFEEFEVGVISFLHENSLTRLKDSGYISDIVMIKSSELRRKVFEIIDGEKWNVASVKNSDVWKEIMLLSDEIKKIIEQEKRLDKII